MEDIGNCTKCNSSNLLFNIWGYPIADAMNELEASGYEVNIMGCDPPIMGEETFIYHCKDCGEKFGDYEDEYE
jgi:hypothetical protein